MSITIELPLPDKCLHPNGRTRSWQKRARLVKTARAEAKLVAGQHRPKVPHKAVTMHATFYMPRRMDGDNLNSWLKFYIDGIADAGIVANDSGVTLLPPAQVTGKKHSPRVEIRIEPIERGER